MDEAGSSQGSKNGERNYFQALQQFQKGENESVPRPSRVL